MNDEFSVNKTTADATIPDPEELGERKVEEFEEVPLPQKVSKDFDAGGEGADDDNEMSEGVELDDDLSDSEDKEDLSHGDEGIDDPHPSQKA